jgi:hypothetical protein
MTTPAARVAIDPLLNASQRPSPIAIGSASGFV